MRPLRFILRRLFGSAALLSFLLLLAVLGSWVRSYRAVDEIHLEDAGGFTSYLMRDGVVQRWQSAYIGSGRGGDTWAVHTVSFAVPPDSVSSCREDVFSPPRLGIRQAQLPPWKDWGPQTVWEVPFGWLVAASAVLPMAWAACRIVGRRRARGLAATTPRPRARRGWDRLAIASALLCLAMAVAWMQSLRWHDYLVRWQSSVELTVGSLPLESCLTFSFDRPPREPTRTASRGLEWGHHWTPPEDRTHFPPEPRVLPWFGTGELRTPLPGADHFVSTPDPSGGPPSISSLPVTGYSVSVPYWSIVLLTALLPAWRAARWWRRRRLHGPGRCSRCGYDLRASPDRCPECGQPCRRAFPAHPLRHELNLPDVSR